MALGDPYASLLEFKSYLKVEDTEDDAEMTSALAAASREIETYCERQFNKATVATARVYAPAYAGWLMVHDFHTTDDLEIATGSGYGTVWGATDYSLEPLNGMVGAETGWPYFRIRAAGKTFTPDVQPTVRVTAQWGWAAVPAPVKQACLIVASETLKLKDAPFGVAGYGEYGVVRVRNSPVACRLLAPYRLRPVKAG